MVKVSTSTVLVPGIYVDGDDGCGVTSMTTLPNPRRVSWTRKALRIPSVVKGKGPRGSITAWIFQARANSKVRVK